MLQNEYTRGFTATQLAEYDRLMGLPGFRYPDAAKLYIESRRPRNGDELAQVIAEWVRRDVA
jgi:hypothetical protein